MLPTTAPQSTKTLEHRHSCPGKVFILGEYAVLAGAPAWVATVEPRFELHTGRGTALLDLFHPESPAGKLLATNHAGVASPNGEFRDPWQNQGGLGASTAQFALTFCSFYGKRDWKEILASYRELTSDVPVPPSGADLVAQTLGGIIRYEPAADSAVQLLQRTRLDWSRFLFFSATGQKSRKVATHSHLNGLKSFSATHAKLIRDLKNVLHQADRCSEAGDHDRFGKLLSQYGDLLKEYDLEIPATTEDRLVVGRIPGVLGIKGTGALQADGILVLIDPAKANRKQLVETAAARDLVLVSDGFHWHRGLE